MSFLITKIFYVLFVFKNLARVQVGYLRCSNLSIKTGITTALR